MAKSDSAASLWSFATAQCRWRFAIVVLYVDLSSVGQPATHKTASLYYANANGAGLYTSNQVQALNVDTPLLAKNPSNGLFRLTIGVQKATQLTNFVPFPMTAPQTLINGAGKLEFQFPSTDNAAFFLLQSQ